MSQIENLGKETIMENQEKIMEKMFVKVMETLVMSSGYVYMFSYFCTKDTSPRPHKWYV